MIALNLPASSDASEPFVTRLEPRAGARAGSSRLEYVDENRSLWSGEYGLLEISQCGEDLRGDVVLMHPAEGRLERLLRKNSPHNTLLVTEQCDQLCVMCSQPPKKTHIDRFSYFTEACLHADEGVTIGISGGEPTLHKNKLFDMIEEVFAVRPDLNFHVLSNAQHFDEADVERLCRPAYRKVVWGIPLYSKDPSAHDTIVGKIGAFERLLKSFKQLLLAGARIELRTVIMSQNIEGIAGLAQFAAAHLPFIEQWSIMDLENAGFARRRFHSLRVDLADDFSVLSGGLDLAIMHGLPVRLFNIPLCHVPVDYRYLAVASISDWKKKFGRACGSCSAKSDCAGFFEWHPQELIEKVFPL